ncbi:MAG: OmpH family outer membrane protein [Capsulimonadaceae bacterium]
MSNMKITATLGRMVIAVGVGFAVAGPIGAAGAPASTPPAGSTDPMPTFACVDLSRIQAGSNKTADIKAKIRKMGDSYQSRLNTQQSYPMLSADQQQQLGNLLGEDTPTDQDKATITQLEGQSQHDTQELATLQQKTPLTDADSARLTALQSEQKAGTQALQQVQTDYEQTMKTFEDKVIGDFETQIQSSVAAVAKERGLTIVFDIQTAQSDSPVLYCSNDITDDVLKKLNK